MSEVGKLRALLAEAREKLFSLGGYSAGAYEQGNNRLYSEIKKEVEELHKSIDAALAEPVTAEYSQDEVNEMTTDMIAIRKEAERAAYQRGAEAMREAAARQCETASPTHGRPTTVGSGYAAAIRALPIPEDKP